MATEVQTATSQTNPETIRPSLTQVQAPWETEVEGVDPATLLPSSTSSEFLRQVGLMNYYLNIGTSTRPTVVNSHKENLQVSFISDFCPIQRVGAMEAYGSS